MSLQSGSDDAERRRLRRLALELQLRQLDEEERAHASSSSWQSSWPTPPHPHAHIPVPSREQVDDYLRHHMKQPLGLSTGWIIEHRPVDVYTLFTSVVKMGGSSEVTARQQWPALTELLRLARGDSSGVAQSLRIFFLQMLGGLEVLWDQTRVAEAESQGSAGPPSHHLTSTYRPIPSPLPAVSTAASYRHGTPSMSATPPQTYDAGAGRRLPFPNPAPIMRTPTISGPRSASLINPASRSQATRSPSIAPAIPRTTQPPTAPYNAPSVTSVPAQSLSTQPLPVTVTTTRAAYSSPAPYIAPTVSTFAELVHSNALPLPPSGTTQNIGGSSEHIYARRCHDLRTTAKRWTNREPGARGLSPEEMLFWTNLLAVLRKNPAVMIPAIENNGSPRLIPAPIAPQLPAVAPTSQPTAPIPISHQSPSSTASTPTGKKRGPPIGRKKWANGVPTPEMIAAHQRGEPVEPFPNTKPKRPEGWEKWARGVPTPEMRAAYERGEPVVPFFKARQPKPEAWESWANGVPTPAMRTAYDRGDHVEPFPKRKGERKRKKAGTVEASAAVSAVPETPEPLQNGSLREVAPTATVISDARDEPPEPHRATQNGMSATSRRTVSEAQPSLVHLNGSNHAFAQAPSSLHKATKPPKPSLSLTNLGPVKAVWEMPASAVSKSSPGPSRDASSMNPNRAFITASRQASRVEHERSDISMIVQKEAVSALSPARDLMRMIAERQKARSGLSTLANASLAQAAQTTTVMPISTDAAKVSKEIIAGIHAKGRSSTPASGSKIRLPTPVTSSSPKKRIMLSSGKHSTALVTGLDMPTPSRLVPVARALPALTPVPEALPVTTAARPPGSLPLSQPRPDNVVIDLTGIANTPKSAYGSQQRRIVISPSITRPTSQASASATRPRRSTRPSQDFHLDSTSSASRLIPRKRPRSTSKALPLKRAPIPARKLQLAPRPSAPAASIRPALQNRIAVVIPLHRSRRAELIRRGHYRPFRDDYQDDEGSRGNSSRPMNPLPRGSAARSARPREPEVIPNRFVVRPGPGIIEPYTTVLQESNMLRRTQERLCGWRGCDSVLASEALLKRHVEARRHADQGQFQAGLYGFQTLWKCHWSECEQPCFETVGKLEQHMMARHISRVLPCPYPDCELVSQNVSHLSRHVMKQHDSDPAQPRPLATALLAPPLPRTIPQFARTDELTTPAVQGTTYRSAFRRDFVRQRVQSHCFAGDDPVIHVEHPPHILDKVETSDIVQIPERRGRVPVVEIRVWQAWKASA